VVLSARLFESLARSVRSAWRLPEYNRYAWDFIKAVTEVEAKRPLQRFSQRCGDTELVAVLFSVTEILDGLRAFLLKFYAEVPWEFVKA